jgi:carbohydrate-selective porin OprB
VNGDTGLLLPVNTYGAFPLTDPPNENVPIAITELNYTQFLSEHFGLLVGKITTMKNANEFAGGEGRTQFMNFQFLFTETEPGTRVDPRNGRQDLQGIGLFASFGLGDEDTNPVSWATSVGLSGRGVIPGRDDDTMGVGYFYNRLQTPRPLLSTLLTKSTQGVEAYYNVALLRSTELTFDFQWMNAALSRTDDGLVLGSRLKDSF